MLHLLLMIMPYFQSEAELRKLPLDSLQRMAEIQKKRTAKAFNELKEQIVFLKKEVHRITKIKDSAIKELYKIYPIIEEGEIRQQRILDSIKKQYQQLTNSLKMNISKMQKGISVKKK